MVGADQRLFDFLISLKENQGRAKNLEELSRLKITLEVKSQEPEGEGKE
jgi:hypothetical protein